MVVETTRKKNVEQQQEEEIACLLSHPRPTILPTNKKEKTQTHTHTLDFFRV
jgi:hypothetical protein